MDIYLTYKSTNCNVRYKLLYVTCNHVTLFCPLKSWISQNRLVFHLIFIETFLWVLFYLRIDIQMVTPALHDSTVFVITLQNYYCAYWRIGHLKIDSPLYWNLFVNFIKQWDLYYTCSSETTCTTGEKARLNRLSTL